MGEILTVLLLCIKIKVLYLIIINLKPLFNSFFGAKKIKL